MRKKTKTRKGKGKQESRRLLAGFASGNSSSWSCCTLSTGSRKRTGEEAVVAAREGGQPGKAAVAGWTNRRIPPRTPVWRMRRRRPSQAQSRQMFKKMGHWNFRRQGHGQLYAIPLKDVSEGRRRRRRSPSQTVPPLSVPSRRFNVFSVRFIFSSNLGQSGSGAATVAAVEDVRGTAEGRQRQHQGRRNPAGSVCVSEVEIRLFRHLLREQLIFRCKSRGWDGRPASALILVWWRTIGTARDGDHRDRYLDWFLTPVALRRRVAWALLRKAETRWNFY